MVFWPITEKIRDKMIQTVLSVFRRCYEKYEEFHTPDYYNQIKKNTRKHRKTFVNFNFFSDKYNYKTRLYFRLFFMFQHLFILRTRRNFQFQ